jgi:hypothetical protein
VTIGAAARGVAKRRRYDTAPTKSSDCVVFPVEIKVNVVASRADVVAALALDPAAGSAQQIWFAEGRAGVERGQLPLLANHVIVRLRVGGGVDELTVKLRPCDGDAGRANDPLHRRTIEPRLAREDGWKVRMTYTG